MNAITDNTIDGVEQDAPCTSTEIGPISDEFIVNENESAVNPKSKEDNGRERNDISTSIISTNNPNKEKDLRPLLLLTTCLYIFLYTGAFYGWGPMQLMLEDSGHFASQCNTSINEEDELPCPKQSAMLLNVQFIACLTMILSPFLGAGIDHYGPSTIMNVTFLIGAIGIALLTIATSTGIDGMLFPSFFLIGFMSMVTGLFTVQTGLLFPAGRSRDRVISGLNALLDAGGVTYLILWYAEEITGLSLPAISGVYLGVYVGIMCVSVICWRKIELGRRQQKQEQEVFLVDEDVFRNDDVPDQQHRDCSAKESNASSTMNLEEASMDATMDATMEIDVASNVNSKHSIVPFASEHINIDLSGPCERFVENETHLANGTNDQLRSSYTLIAQRPHKKQLMSCQFITLATYFAFHNSHNLWILTTTRNFLASLGDDEVGNKYLSIFTLLTPVSILGLPFVDIILHQYGYAAGLHIINLLGIAVEVVRVSSTNLSVQIIGFVLYSFYRCFIFSVVFSCLPTFLSSDVLGKGCGFLILCSGILSFVINIPLSNITMNHLEGNFFVANMFYMMGCIPCVYLCEIIRRGFVEERLKKEGMASL